MISDTRLNKRTLNYNH